MVGKERREPVRLVEPVSLLGLSLGDVLLGLRETGEGQPGPAPPGPAAAEEGRVLEDGSGQPERRAQISACARLLGVPP